MRIYSVHGDSIENELLMCIRLFLLRKRSFKQTAELSISPKEDIRLNHRCRTKINVFSSCTLSLKFLKFSCSHSFCVYRSSRFCTFSFPLFRSISLQKKRCEGFLLLSELIRCSNSSSVEACCCFVLFH